MLNNYNSQQKFYKIKSLHEEYVILASATKIVLRELSPITVVWMRFTMGVIILGIAVVMRK